MLAKGSAELCCDKGWALCLEMTDDCWTSSLWLYFLSFYCSRGSHEVKNFSKSLLHNFGPGEDAVFKLHLNPGH